MYDKMYERYYLRYKYKIVDLDVIVYLYSLSIFVGYYVNL